MQSLLIVPFFQNFLPWRAARVIVLQTLLNKNKNQHNMKILYFDDSHYLYQSIRQYCRASSYVVDIVHNVSHAYTQWKTFHYDVVIVDLQADFGAGLSFIEKLRADNLAVPIIAC